MHTIDTTLHRAEVHVGRGSAAWADYDLIDTEERMRAAIQNGVGEIDVRDIAAPGEAGGLVRVLAAGVCGSDLHEYLQRAEPQSLPDGHEVAGEVMSLPDAYAGPLRVGDLVAVDTICHGKACGACAFCRAGQTFHCLQRAGMPGWGGAFADLIRRQPAGMFKLPPGMSAEQGALVEPLAVGVHAVRRAGMAQGATVVVVGAGTIGLMTLLAARALGAANVYVLARHAHQATAAKAFGATSVVRAEASDAVAAIHALTDGLGADLVVEAVGRHAEALELAWQVVRPQGSVAVLGIFPQPVLLNLMRPILREVSITFPICYGVIDGRHDFEVAIEIIASGRVDTAGMVTHRFALEDAADAFRTAADKSSGSLKVHICP
jgi:L-iditol 2-dehydrogenase